MNVSLIALSIGLFLVLNALTESFEGAFRAPLESVGADLTVQRSGDVPEEMVGPVLPCSVAPLHSDEISRIREMDGVISVSRGLLFWDFGPAAFTIAAGFAPEDSSGFALLNKTLTSGRFLEREESGKALVEKSHAEASGLNVGDRIEVGGTSFEIVGIVDSSRLSHLTASQVYMTLADAQKLAFSSKGVSAVHDFRPEDANMLFVKARRDRVNELKTEIADTLGKETTVTSPASFGETLGGLFQLTARFSGIVSLLALLVAAVLTARTTMANVRERRLEIGVMKAVGWRRNDITGQLGAETLVQVFLGTVLGLVAGAAVAQLLSLVEISIPIPWDMSPRPHFLPGGADQLYKTVRLQLSVSPLLCLYSPAAAVAIGLSAAWAGTRISTELKASEALRDE
jgi:putative ABC transport system permease protein